MIRTQHVLDSWRSLREDTIAAVEEFPADQFDFRVTPEMQTFGEIARHILRSSEGLTGLLLAGERDFAAPGWGQRFPQHVRELPPEASVEELGAALRESLDRRLAELAAQPAEFMAAEVTRWDGVKLTCLEMVQFIKEHELTHQCQLFACLRLKGMTPSTTRRRMARLAKQAT